MYRTTTGSLEHKGMNTFRLKDMSFSMIPTNEEMLPIRRVRGLLRSVALKKKINLFGMMCIQRFVQNMIDHQQMFH
jgi:hypothetical protein